MLWLNNRTSQNYTRSNTKVVIYEVEKVINIKIDEERKQKELKSLTFI